MKKKLLICARSVHKLFYVSETKPYALAIAGGKGKGSAFRVVAI